MVLCGFQSPSAKYNFEKNGLLENLLWSPFLVSKRPKVNLASRFSIELDFAHNPVQLLKAKWSHIA